jgi:hypothetical protein
MERAREEDMKARSIIIVLSALCVFMGWKLMARQQSQQGSNNLAMQVIVASDADLNLLRQDLRGQKQKLIAQNLPMTESEATKFWAVYNRYTEELKPIYGEKFQLIKRYGEQWQDMGNDEALIYIRRWLELDDQAHQLRSKYVVPVSEVLPGKKAATFFQLDRRISMMLDIQLASQLPLAYAQDSSPQTNPQ